nr:ATP-binding protein [uncultured Sphingomonas sp.]
MIPAMIATAVAPETITKVTRLFNNTAYDVICELFQNARRAGATGIAVAVIPAPDATYLEIVDDGHGIDDPASIVTLGRSGWSDDTRKAEDPAGMGVFSLAGRDVIIRSYSRPDRQGWMAHIPASAWETSRPIAISTDPIALGTSIMVRMPDSWVKTIERDVAAAALHFPVPVTFNGTIQDRKDWLADAAYIENWNGTRIGICKTPAPQHSRHSQRLNFHGVTIPCDLPTLSEVDRGHIWTARIDILNAPSIQLVLPARKEVVENAGIEALRAAVQRALFHAVAAEGTHRLSFENWSKARDLGIALPEAEPYLWTWTAPAADSSRNFDTGGRTSDPAMVLIPDFDALIAQPAERAIVKHNPFGGPLVEAKAAFEGYGWYDCLARVEALGFRVTQGDLVFEITDGEPAPAEAQDGWVDAITLEATIAHAGAYVEVACDADVAFAPSDAHWNSADDTSIFVRRDSGARALDVADLFESAAFCPSDDGDADSYDTQQERFQRFAASRIIGLLEGGDAALASRIRDLLAGHYYLIPADRTVAITVTSTELTVAIAPLATEAAS